MTRDTRDRGTVGEPPRRARASGASAEGLEGRRLFTVLYTITDLGSLPATTGPTAPTTMAYGINDAGQVVGTSGGAAFLYTDGQMRDLGVGTSPDGANDARAINAAGEIAGERDILTTGTGYVYSGGAVQVIPTANAGDMVLPRAINREGQVVGNVQPASSDGGTRAFLFAAADGTYTDLGTLGGAGARAAAINDAGQVVGTVTTKRGATHAFLYAAGTTKDLGTLGGTSATADAIDDAGDICGTITTRGGREQAYVLSQGKVRLLGPTSFVAGFNDAGTAVGAVGGPDGPVTPVVYRDGGVWNLNTLIDPAAGVTLQEATGINNAGQIIANGLGPGFAHDAYLLTPVSPAPTPIGTFGATDPAHPNRTTPLSFDQNGSTVTLTLRGGTGVAYRDGTSIGLTLSGNCSLAIDVTGGPTATDGTTAARLPLASLSVTGDLRSLAAPTVDVTGRCTVTGSVRSADLGDISGVFYAYGSVDHLTAGDLSGTLASADRLGRVRLADVTGVVASLRSVAALDVQSLSHARVLVGRDLGLYGQPGDTGFSQTTGSIGSLLVRGDITASAVTTYHLFTGSIPGPGSKIRSLVSRGSADPDSTFMANAFGHVRLPGPIDPHKDPRSASP